MFGDLMKSVVRLADNTTDVVLAPAKLAVDAANMLVEPMADAARDLADSMNPNKED